MGILPVCERCKCNLINYELEWTRIDGMGDRALFARHDIKENVRLPGFEPGLRAWEAHVITAGPQPLSSLDLRHLFCHFLLPIFKCFSFGFS